MSKATNILISAIAGYYLGKLLSTKNDTLNIAVSIGITAITNQLLNSKN